MTSYIVDGHTVPGYKGWRRAVLSESKTLYVFKMSSGDISSYYFITSSSKAFLCTSASVETNRNTCLFVISAVHICCAI